MKKALKILLSILLLVAAIDVFMFALNANVLDLPYVAGQPDTLGIDTSQEIPRSNSVWENIEVKGETKEDTGEESDGNDVNNVEFEKYNEFLSSGYAYNLLDDDMKILYIEVYAALVRFADTVDVSVHDIDKLNLGFQCVMIDHPEIFYTSGYSYSQYTRGDVITRLTFSPTYICTEEEADMLSDEMEQVIKEILVGVSMDADDYTKVKYIYDYLVHNTEYDADSPDNQNICSVFLNKRSVCQGYSKATQLLLNRLGLECTLVTGVVNENEGHSWNLVKMNGDWYYVDTTLGDASYQSIEGAEDEWLKNLDIVNYDYLGVTTAELLRTHVIDNPVDLPYCTATSCNYYVREGTLLEGPDSEGLKAILLSHPVTRGGNTTIKCKDEQTYNWILNELITESKIFDYVDGGGSVGYAQNEDALSLTLWLDD